MELSIELDNKSSTKNPVSIQTWQEMHKALNHKSDALSNKWYEARKFTLDELRNLHANVLQVAEGYNLCDTIVTINVSYVDNQSPTYESFETFQRKVIDISSAIKSISFEYNFLMSHSQTKKIFNYKIDIRVISQVAVYDKIRKQDDLFTINRFMFARQIQSSYLKIEYVDIVYADSFMNRICKVFDDISYKKTPKYVAILKKFSHYSTLLSMFIFIPLGAYFLSNLFIWLHLGLDVNKISKFIIFSAAGSIIFLDIVRRLGRSLEYKIDSYMELGCIDITSGDKKILKDYAKNKRNSITRVLVNISGQVLIGVVSSIIISCIHF